MNIIVNEINSIGFTKIEDVDIAREIISVLPHEKYASIITVLHNTEDLRKMTLLHVIGKLVAFEVMKDGTGRRPLHQAKA